MVMPSRCFPERLGMLQVHAGAGQEKELALVVPALAGVHEGLKLGKLLLFAKPLGHRLAKFSRVCLTQRPRAYWSEYSPERIKHKARAPPLMDSQNSPVRTMSMRPFAPLI